MRALALLLRVLVGAVLLVVVIAAALFGFVQTPPGKALLARVASELASSEGLQVRISGLEGFVPSDLRVREVVLSDLDGEFARLEGLALRWNPLDLLSGTVSVSSLTAADIEMSRRPNLPASTDSGSGGLPNIRVVVDELAAQRIGIGEPVLGTPAMFSLDGQLRLVEPAQGIFVDFRLQRTDAEGLLSGTVRFAPETETLVLDLAAQEPPGGLLARVAGFEGLPALDATLKGDGTLSDWTGQLHGTAGTLARIDGTATLRAEPAARFVQLAVTGDVSGALPAAYRPLFEGESELRLALRVAEDGGFAVPQLQLNSTGLSVEASGSLPSSGPISMTFRATPGAAERFVALVPDPAWTRLELTGDLSGTLTAPELKIRIDGEGLGVAGYGASNLTAEAGMTPGTGGIFALAADARLTGLSAADPNVAKALGDTGTLSLRGDWPRDAEPALTGAAVRLTALDLDFTGRATSSATSGRLNVPRLDLAALSPFAGRPLAGLVALDADVTRDGDGAISLTLRGNSQDVATGVAVLDGLVGGAAQVSGGLSYAPDGAVGVTDLRLAASGATLALNGRIDTAQADLAGTLSLPDLSRVDPRLEGTADAKAAFSGNLSALGVTGEVSVPRGRAMGHPVEGLTLGFTARDLTGAPAGDVTLAGQVGGKPTRGGAQFATLADGGHSLSDLALSVGSVSAQGALTLAASGLATGDLAFTAGDLADLSAFALTNLAGRGSGRVVLDTPNGVQRVAVRADLNQIAAEGQRVATARIDLSLTDPRRSAAIEGQVDATGIESGGVSVPRLRLTATPEAGGTRLALDTTAAEAAITAGARLAMRDDAQTLRLDTLRVVRAGTTLQLSQPATFTYQEGAVAVDRLALAVGGGTLVAQGRAGETLDLTLDARAIPLSLAALAAPGIAPSGTLAATARIGGTPAAPTGQYDVTVTRATMPELTSAGAGPFNARASGRLEGGRASISATLTGPSLSGVTVNGWVPVSGGALDLAIRGNVALGIANALLATSGARASGNAAIDATLRGSFADPRAGGTVRITNGRYEDALNGVTLENIQAVITGAERNVTLSSFQASTRNGGSVRAQGNVALDPGAGFPGRFDITLANAGLINSDLMRFVADGQLNLSGALLRTPTVAGRIDVRSLDVNIPDRLPGGSAAIDVRHVNVPRGQQFTTLRTPPQPPGRAAPASAFVATLDLTINAPNRVFVRGMGMEAELAGNLQLRGTSAEPVTLGGFEMLRGRFDIIGRRLDFTRGRLTFNGSLDPDLDFIAESSANDITARVMITGQASQPIITFSSTPTLPQDEVVARLLFGRATGQLSAGQALQVAQAVASLSGGGSGALSSLRQSLGLDSLDVGTDATGTGGQVGLGRRLNDRVYLGVQQGTTVGSSRATIDVDITRNIRLQGSTGATGDTSVGIGAQWDY